MDLGSRIQTLRKKAGLSQEALADALSISRQALSKWESGASLPTLDNLLQLAKLFEISLDELITGEEPPSAGQEIAQDTAARQETLETLLRHMESGRRKSGIWLTALCALFAAIALSAGIYAGVRTAFLESELQNLNQRIVERIADQNDTIQSIYQNVQEQMDNAAMVEELKNRDYTFRHEITGYIRERDTVGISFMLTPREYHVDDTVEFLLTPLRGGSVEGDLEETVVVPAVLRDEQYIAEAEIPVVDFINIYLRKTSKDGNVTQEYLTNEHHITRHWVPQLEVENYMFTFEKTSDKLILWGKPYVTVNLPGMDPRGWNAKLVSILTYGDQVIYTESIDLNEWHKEVMDNSTKGMDPEEKKAFLESDTHITTHDFVMNDESYRDLELDLIKGETLVWTFQLIYDDGETYEEELSWRT